MTAQIEAEDFEPHFTPKAIREAIESLRQLLGDTNVVAIISDVELYGLLTADNRVQFNIEQIYTALERMFGEGASFLIRPINEALLKGKI
jgi:hypothetical protein